MNVVHRASPERGETRAENDPGIQQVLIFNDTFPEICHCFVISFMDDLSKNINGLFKCGFPGMEMG